MIVGIDVGTNVTGMAALRDDGSMYGMWKIQLRGEVNERLRNLYDGIGEPFTYWYGQSLWVYIERPPYTNNVHTHAVLHQAVGVVKVAAMNGGVLPRNICELTPAEIKKCFTGNGRASKTRVQEAAREYAQYSQISEDEADALATAYTGWCKQKEMGNA